MHPIVVGFISEDVKFLVETYGSLFLSSSLNVSHAAV